MGGSKFCAHLMGEVVTSWSIVGKTIFGFTGRQCHLARLLFLAWSFNFDSGDAKN